MRGDTAVSFDPLLLVIMSPAAPPRCCCRARWTSWRARCCACCCSTTCTARIPADVTPACSAAATVSDAQHPCDARRPAPRPSRDTTFPALVMRCRHGARRVWKQIIVRLRKVSERTFFQAVTRSFPCTSPLNRSATAATVNCCRSTSSGSGGCSSRHAASACRRSCCSRACPAQGVKRQLPACGGSR